MRYEVCVETADGVRAALDAGADRVELCANLAVGGITPSAGLTEWAVEASGQRLGVHVLIRPRGGDFVYDAAETDVMVRDIRAVKAAGADGVVIGALTPDRTVDVTLTGRLMEVARPLSVTFHRAFDETADPLAAFGDVLSLGADRLLTSGGAPTATEGAEMIRELVGRSAAVLAQGDSLPPMHGGARAPHPPGPLESPAIVVMAGGGVTESTAADLARRTGVAELHFSARSSATHLPLKDRIARIMAAATG